MTLTIPILMFALGGVLTLVGALGGGFEVHELKIPKVNWITRVISAIVGILFILIAFGSEPDKAANGNASNPPLEPAGRPEPDRRINFELTDELGEGQVLESTRVYINGSQIGEFSLSPQSRRASIAGWASDARPYNYKLESSLTLDRDDGQQDRVQCHGEGVVHLVEGARYAVRFLGVQNEECLEDLVAVQ